MVNLVELTHVVDLLDRRVPRRIVDKGLAEAGLDRAMLEGSKGFFPYAAEAILVEFVARAVGDRHLGARVGREFDYMTYGAYSGYVLSAPDLGTALDRGRRAMLFIHPGSEIVLRQSDTHLIVGRDSAGLSVIGHRHLDEGAPFVISQVAYHFLGVEWRPDWVELPSVLDSDLKDLEELTGTTVRTDCEIPSIAIRLSDLAAPNPGAPELHKPLSLAELGVLMEISPTQKLAKIIAQLLEVTIKKKVTDEKTVARLLAISPRTMQRALKAEGTSFRDIRSAAIEKKAQSLLVETETPIADIAKALGYSDVRAFRRAFKKSSGRSPSEFRSGRSLK
ncbi:AraC family transcriptional regulator [uncultured Shimia sp.]|uniref:helix-turn-helix domain-containing protein n=1 Tax=uncultured Shimia sp. TaxID=573152 RepID=UPI00261F1F12|nr:AraC family transcriptional regulator [uncultured Shimia sp.]